MPSNDILAKLYEWALEGVRQFDPSAANAIASALEAGSESDMGLSVRDEDPPPASLSASTSNVAATESFSSQSGESPSQISRMGTDLLFLNSNQSGIRTWNRTEYIVLIDINTSP